ncbi:MAG: hypothetical protein LBF83_02290 [Spirochaetaceae bacterium]|jgi:hypothetical protein|nr:hypothetical protein [Spirochaetaceae bacterium]
MFDAAERIYNTINKDSPRVILAGDSGAALAAGKFKTGVHKLNARPAPHKKARF